MANHAGACPGEARCLHAIGDRLSAMAQSIREHPAKAVRSPQGARIAQRLDASAQNLRESAESIEKLEKLVELMLREDAITTPGHAGYAPQG